MGRVRVKDGSGALEIAYEGDRVTSVVVAADWARRVGPHGLGGAALEAVVTAQLSRVDDEMRAAEAMMTEVTAAVGRVEARRRGAGSATTSPEREAAREAARRMASTTWSELGALSDVVMRAARTGRAPGPGLPPTPAPDVGRSRNRRVVVALVGGMVAEVTVDDAWARSAGRQQLSDALLEAFTDAADVAAAAAAARAAEARVQADPSGELSAVLERFGLFGAAAPPPGPARPGGPARHGGPS